MPTIANPQELTPSRLPLSPGARELLWRFHETVEKAQAAGGSLEHIKAYASKAVKQAARIAGVLMLWTDLEAPMVSPQTMGWGVTLADFYLGEAKRPAEAGAVSADTDRAEILRKWLLDSWPHTTVTPREIVQFGPNRLRESAAVRSTVAVLEKHGWLAKLPEGTEVRGAARKEAYRIVRPHLAPV